MIQPSKPYVHPDVWKQLVATSQVPYKKSHLNTCKISTSSPNLIENNSDNEEEDIESLSNEGNHCDGSSIYTPNQGILPPYIIRNGETLYLLFPSITKTEMELVLHPNCQTLNCHLTRIPPQPLDLSPHIEIFKNLDLSPITTQFSIQLPFKVSAQRCPPLNFNSGEWLGIQFQKATSEVGHHLGKLNIVK